METFSEDEQALLIDAGWELNNSKTRAEKDWRRMRRYDNLIMVDLWIDDSENGGGWWEDDANFRSVAEALSVANRLSS